MKMESRVHYTGRVPENLTAADYAAAAALLPGKLRGLIRNASVEPNWVGDCGAFWYCRDGKEGPEFVLVNSKRRRSPAFDHRVVARALAGAVTANGGGSTGLPSELKQARLSDDLKHLSGQIGANRFDIDLDTLELRVPDAPVAARELLPSPDGRWVAFVRDDNLYVRECATGQRRQLTVDGELHYSWCQLPGGSLMTVARARSDLPVCPFDTAWSPDSRYLIAPRVDERNVAVYPFVEWVPCDGSRRPRVYSARLALPGDRETARIEYFLFDLTSRTRRAIVLPEGYRPGFLDPLVLDWSPTEDHVLLLARTVESKSLAVLRLDLATAKVSRVLEESSSTRMETNTLLYSRPNIRLLRGAAELVWYSDRSGWGHLYLYDARSGEFKNAITQGDWLVRDILAVDETRREIYFTAVGRESGRDPYYRHLYRAPLDGAGDIILLTEPNADHRFDPAAAGPIVAQLFPAPPRMPLINTAGDVFIDTWSTVDQPPVSVLRSTRDGHMITELEQSDVAQLYATGWKPPVRECVKAADGRTNLYATYFAPYGRSVNSTHPVVDAAYGGPQIVVTPWCFHDTAPFLGQSALARLGFAVITVDARGTPMRSRAFRDVGYPEFTRVGIEDHIAAIRQLADRHPEMNLQKVGVYGWSWGGTFSAQAILSRPEFYKVAISGAGAYDYAGMYQPLDFVIGPASYTGGSRYRTHIGEPPAAWQKLDVTRLARRLTGHLMLIYGDVDENVPAQQAMELVAALTRANKHYDLVFLPNRSHYSKDDGYVIKRTWDYFIEHLHGMQPVADFEVRSGTMGF